MINLAVINLIVSTFLFSDLLTLCISLEPFSNPMCGRPAPSVSSCVECALMALTLGGYCKYQMH